MTAPNRAVGVRAVVEYLSREPRWPRSKSWAREKVDAYRLRSRLSGSRSTDFGMRAITCGSAV